VELGKVLSFWGKEYVLIPENNKKLFIYNLFLSIPIYFIYLSFVIGPLLSTIIPDEYNPFLMINFVIFFGSFIICFYHIFVLIFSVISFKKFNGKILKIYSLFNIICSAGFLMIPIYLIILLLTEKGSWP
jgi:hypothetical protein